MRILFVHPTLGAGGTEAQLILLARHARERGMEAEIVRTAKVPDYPGEALGQLESWGVPVYRVTDGPLLLPFHRRLARVLRERRPVCVVGTCATSQGRVVHVARNVGVPSRIAWFRSSHTYRWPPTPRNLLCSFNQRLALRSATRLLGNSRNVVEAHFPDRCDRDPRMGVVGNGYELSVFAPGPDTAAMSHRLRGELGLNPQHIVLGHVGRVHDAKNHSALRAAFAQVAEQLEEARLLLVGYGRLEAQIRREIASLGLQSRVVLTGIRRDIPALLHAMDVFVFPSVYEGSPNALLEAMAAGRPFVASNIGCIREVVPDAWHAFLLAPSDATGLARAVLRLVHDAPMRVRMAQECMQRVREQHAVSAVLARLKALIEADLANEPDVAAKGTR